MKLTRIIAIFGIVILFGGLSLANAKDLAPDFSLPDQEGHIYNLHDFKGNVVVLNFWASWCPECIAEMPELERFYRHYKDKKVVLLGINIDKSEKKAVDIIKSQNISFLNLMDRNGDVFIDRYAIFGLPATIVIGPDMRIEKRIIGPTNFDTLKKIVERLKGG